MNRRDFLLQTLLGLGGAPLTAPFASGIDFPSNPFTLGIASGDVTDSSVILWTRLAPNPLAVDGGMDRISVAVKWELFLDAGLAHIVQQGQALAIPALAHSVHVDVAGLQAGRQYWYRFSVAGHRSQIGRTKTLPNVSARSGVLRFVTASCQNYTHGYFIAYQHIVEDKPDFVIHLGDYIYDTAFGETFRKHETDAPPMTLADYRRRHALYKTDRHLQQAHARIPFFTMIDNHDAIEDRDADKFQQRAAAYQAWYEHMPVRGYGAVGDNYFALHRKIVIGDLVQVSLLDARQFRDKKDLCRENLDPNFGFGNYRERCNALLAENRTLLGSVQEAWLQASLTQNKSAWNVIASPGPFLPFRLHKDGKELAYIGAWDAYPANRKRIVAAIHAANSGHPLVLSGDVHSFWAVDGALISSLRERIEVVEFVTSSLGANWPQALSQPVTDNLSHNPQVKFYGPEHRGYLLHEVNRSSWTTTARAVKNYRDAQSSVFSLARFLVQNGKPGFMRID